MTGVGYAAPVLFEVFGLLPKGEWFAEPLGDLEPAVVCRQSGYLASHICPDRDTVMIPRAAALGEVCPYHRIVNLSADLKYRVTADCYDPARIVRMPMFILPPAQEWYYRRQHPDYRPLPPLHPGLPGNRAENNPIDIIYPQSGRVLVAPRSLEGEQQSLVFTAVHRDRNAVLFWHIDDDYIGSTSFEHKVSVRPGAGEAPPDRDRRTRRFAERRVQLPLTPPGAGLPGSALVRLLTRLSVVVYPGYSPSSCRLCPVRSAFSLRPVSATCFSPSG